MASELSVEEHIRLLLQGEAHQIPCDSCEVSQVDIQLPPWFDEEKFKRGQKYILRNMTGQLAVMLSGLINVLALPTVLTILIKTRKSSSVEGAYRRYLSTLKHVFSWFSDELRPRTVMWRSLCAIRTRHLRSSKMSQMRGDGHISQRDLVLTQFGFFGLGLLKPRIVGMEDDNREDIDGYLHFWRTIGYMLGIDDRYNLCRTSIEETKEICRFICEEVYQKLLYNPPEYFYHMVIELLDGMWYVDSIISANPFIYFTYRLVGVPGFTRPTSAPAMKNVPIVAERHKTTIERNITDGLLRDVNSCNDNILNPDFFYFNFTLLQRLTLYFMACLFQRWMYSFLGRLYCNAVVRMSMLCVHYFPYKGFWRFGWKNSYVDMFADDISLPGELRTNKQVLDVLHNKSGF